MSRPPFHTEGPALVVYDPAAPEWRRFVRRRGRVVGSVVFGSCFTALLVLSAVIAHRTAFAVVGSLLFVAAGGGLILRVLGHYAGAASRRVEVQGVVLLGGHAADCWENDSTRRGQIAAGLWELSGHLAETDDPEAREALITRARSAILGPRGGEPPEDDGVANR